MRKILNKTVSVLCTLAMCLSLVPCVGYADDVKTTDDFVIDEIERVFDIDFYNRRKQIQRREYQFCFARYYIRFYGKYGRRI